MGVNAGSLSLLWITLITDALGSPALLYLPGVPELALKK